jgi:hypothetical protein
LRTGPGAGAALDDRVPPARHLPAGTLQVDGKTVATGRIERTLPFRVSADETLDCGDDTGTSVSGDYQVPFKFTGTLEKVVST